MLNVALPTLVRDLSATSTDLQWIVDAYVLVFGGLLLVAGSLADRVGRKRVFLAGLSRSPAGSAWAAFSGSRRDAHRGSRQHGRRGSADHAVHAGDHH